MFRALSHEQSQRIEDTLKITGLIGRADQSAGMLSHGERQWLEIEMLLLREPKLMLLDEPVAGMTRRERTAPGSCFKRLPGKDRCLWWNTIWDS